MTIKNAIKNVTTKMYVVTRNGKILNLNGIIGGSYNENEPINKVEIVNNVCNGEPAITCIRI